MKRPRHVLFIFLLFIQFTLCFSHITVDNNDTPNGVLKSMGNSLSSILHNNIKNIKDSFLKNTTNITKQMTNLNDDISKNINYINSIFKKSPAEELHAIDKYSKDQLNKLKENPENKLFFSKLFNFNSKSEDNTNKPTEISQGNPNDKKTGFWNFIQNINKSNDNIKEKLEKEKLEKEKLEKEKLEKEKLENENNEKGKNESKWFKFLFPSNGSKDKENEKVENTNKNDNNNNNNVTDKEKDKENESYFFFRKKNDSKETESKEVETKTNNNTKNKWSFFNSFFHTENKNVDKIEKEEQEGNDIEANKNIKEEKKSSFFPFWKSKSDENDEGKNSSISNKIDNNQNTNLDLKNKDDNKNLMNLVKHYYEDTTNLSDENLLSLLNTEHKGDVQVDIYPLAEFKICLNNCHKSLEKNIDENEDKKIIKNLSHSDYKSLEKCISQCKNINLDNIGFKNDEILNSKENNKNVENLKNENPNLNSDIAPAFSDFVALEKYSDNNEEKEDINMKNISTELKNNNFLNMEFINDINNDKNQNEKDNVNGKDLSAILYNTNSSNQNNAINNLQEKTLDVLNMLGNKSDETELNNIKENTQFDDNNENNKKHGYISTSFFLFMVLVTFFIYLSAFTSIINQFYVAFKEKVILYIKEKYRNQLDQINRESSQPFIPKPFNQNYSESASYDSIYNPYQNTYEIS